MWRTCMALLCGLGLNFRFRHRELTLYKARRIMACLTEPLSAVAHGSRCLQCEHIPKKDTKMTQIHCPLCVLSRKPEALRKHSKAFPKRLESSVFMHNPRAFPSKGFESFPKVPLNHLSESAYQLCAVCNHRS